MGDLRCTKSLKRQKSIYKGGKPCRGGTFNIDQTPFGNHHGLTGKVSCTLSVLCPNTGHSPDKATP